MGQCKHHPLSPTVPGDGVCPSCLQKKLKSVRWGETGCSVVTEKAPTNGTKHCKASGMIDPIPPKEAIAILGSIASIKNRNHRGCKPGRDITEAGLDFVLDSRYTDGVTSFRKPLHPGVPIDTRRGGDSRAGFMCPPSKTMSQNAADGSTPDGAVKRWQGKVVNYSKKSSPNSGKSLVLADSKSGSPLVDRTAKETALRVIKEVKDDMSEEGEGEGNDVVIIGNVKGQGKGLNTCFSPSHWQSKMRSKWGLKGLGSPMITSSNKVFPSKSVENVQKLLQAHFSPGRDIIQSRVNVTAQEQEVDHRQPAAAAVQPEVNTQEMVIVGMPDRILKPEDMNQRLKTSYNTVLQWLEDLPVPDTLLSQKIGDPDQDPYLMDIRNSDGYQQDLAVVGHLHEIAEEHEIFYESSVEEASPAPTANHLDNVSSFGKFLIRAAQRQPKQGLSRVQARVTASAR